MTKNAPFSETLQESWPGHELLEFTVGGASYLLPASLTISQAADECAGKRPPADPAHQDALNDWYRRREDCLRHLRPQVTSEGIRASPLRRHVNGWLNEDATEISLWDLFRFVAEIGGAGEPLRRVASAWCSENGYPSEAPTMQTGPGRPSARPMISEGLARLDREGRLSGNAKQDRMRVMEVFDIKEGAPGWSPKTFGRARAAFLLSGGQASTAS